MTLDCVMPFSRIENLNTRKSFRVMVENWKHDILEFSSCHVCKNRNRVLLTSDSLPNISLVVGQSSVNISLMLRAHDVPVSTSRLTSNQ